MVRSYARKGEAHPCSHGALLNRSEGGLPLPAGIRSIKSALVSTIYRNDRLHIYEQKDEQRGLLRQEAEARMAALIGQMATGTLQSDKLELLVTDLAQRLREVSGKKVYGYLPPRVKRIVDEIVDELAKDERVSSAYALWQDLREQLCIDYNQTPPQRVPLSQQKEFKTVRNMVIRETLRLSEIHFTFEDDAISDELEPEEPPVPPDPSAERMIHQRARFYRRAKSILDAADADPSEKSMALVTLHRLWEEGYTIAAHQMGKAYQDGLGTSIDRKAAAEWFQKSAEAGNPALHTRWATAAGAGAIPAGPPLAVAGSGAERSIHAIPARQAAAHRRGRCAEGYRCGHSAS